MGDGRMRYVSLFSGIEAASVAWGPLGWVPMAFAEVDPFPCAVLAERFPQVPNLGDVTEIDWGDFVGRDGRPDVLVGGSPCQSFSVAGNRTGLEGASGLMWEYVRAVRELRPRWLVWENVPGALSSTHGEDFGCLLRSLDELGYGLAWRVLDAQFFGVAQRRRRVFLVGRAGGLGAEQACEVLFEPHCLRGDPPSSREKRQALAAAAGRGAEGADGECMNPADVQSTRIYEPSGIAPTLTAQHGRGSQPPNTFAIAGNVIGRTEGNGGNGCGFEDDGGCYTLTTNDRHAIAYGFKAGQGAAAGGIGFSTEQSPTLTAATSGSNLAPAVLCTTQHGDVVCMTGAAAHAAVDEDMAGTLTAHDQKNPPIVATHD